MRGITGRVTEEQVLRELLRESDRVGRRRARIAAAVVLALAFAVGAVVARMMFTLVDVRGDGMSGALIGGDVALCVKASAPMLGRSPGRGDLALIRYTESGMNRETVRRVVGMAGDVISVEPDGHVTLNGEPLAESYAAYRVESDWTGVGEARPGGALENPFADGEYDYTEEPAQPEAVTQGDDLDYPLTVPEGRLFVLCDNRENALDSRSSRFGLVAEADVLGLVKAVVWPVYRVTLPAEELTGNR